jgi:hypothetical protein
VRNILDRYPDIVTDLEAMLRCIEETVPVQRIWLDTAEEKDTPLTGFVGEPDTEIRQVLEAMFRSLIQNKGLNPEDARARLSRTEPFDRYSNLVASLPDDLSFAGE